MSFLRTKPCLEPVVREYQIIDNFDHISNESKYKLHPDGRVEAIKDWEMPIDLGLYAEFLKTVSNEVEILFEKKAHFKIL